jgi:hypothetical protein
MERIEHVIRASALLLAVLFTASCGCGAVVDKEM